MGTSNPYAAGAKVYNGGSSTATSGTVDPMGYVERNLKMSVKAKPSQTRSGLAKAALTRVKKKTVKKTTKKKVSKKQAILNAYKKTPLRNTVTASPTGKGVNSPKENPIINLPYDLESERISAKQTRDNLLATLNAQASELQTAAQQKLRNLETQYADRKILDLNSSVARGLGNSSQYLNTLTRSASDYTTGKNTIQSEKTNRANEIVNARSRAINSYNDLTASMYREAANRRAQASASGTAGAPLSSTYKAPTPTKAPPKQKTLKLPKQIAPKKISKKKVVR